MALRYDEVLRCKSECGYNVVGVGAEAYGLNSYNAMFEKAIEPYLTDYATTSSTAVTANASGATVAITLASNPTIAGLANQTLAFVQGAKISVDVGPAFETSSIQVISGLTAYCLLYNAHGANGSYPIVLCGAEQVIRDYIARLDVIKDELTNVAPYSAGVETVEGKTKLYASMPQRSRDKFESLLAQRLQARRDLAGALGIPYLPDVRRNVATGYEAY